MFVSTLESAGLYTFPNSLSKAPSGALLQADNLVINRDGVAESRRGLGASGILVHAGGSAQIDTLFSFQNRLVGILNTGVGVGGNYIYDSTGSLDWVHLGNVEENYHRNRFQEANKNLYIASGLGIVQTSTVSVLPTAAGVAPALDGSGALGVSGTGFLAPAFQCAYQVVFGYTDANGNLKLGNPSQRFFVVNATGTAQNTVLTFTLPQGMTTDYFYQIYRTPQTAYSATPASNVPPGAEPQLSSQLKLTAGQIAALSVTVTDVTPDELLGAYLYTNPSQQGPFQTNDRPPFANDICLFSQMMFYANCKTLHSTNFSVLSVGSPSGIQVDDTITVNSVPFNAKATQNNASQQFAIKTSGTVAENIDATARNLVSCINANAATTHVYAYYTSGYNSLPGQIELQGVDYSISTFTVVFSRTTSFWPEGTLISSNDTIPNGIYISKISQPESVPVTNLIFVGGGDQPIYRILPLRDRVIVLKSDGVYVISGSTPQSLSITLLDTTIILSAPESAKLLNNSVYCMTNQGVVSITESGITIQSRPIELDLLRLASFSMSYPYFQGICNAVAYESEHLYILGMPTLTTDYVATQCFCFNWVTNAWTKWSVDMKCGYVNPTNNLLYVSRAVTNKNRVCQERKNYIYSDFVDDSENVTVTSVDPAGLIIHLSAYPDFAMFPESLVGCFFSQTIDSVSYSARITDRNSGPNTITVSLTDSSTPGVVIPWAAGAAAVEVSIPINHMWAPQTAGYPHVVKNWGRCNLWFNDWFPKIGIGFQTEMLGPSQTLTGPLLTLLQIVTDGYGLGPFGGGYYGGTISYPKPIQTLLPVQNGQSRWVRPVLSLDFPRVLYSSYGVTIGYEIISDTGA